MINTVVILATLVAAVVSDSGTGNPVGHSKPGDGYDRGHVFLMKLITYPSSGTRARNANTQDNAIDRGEKLAKPFSTLLLLESVKEDENGYLPDGVYYKPPNVEAKPIYVKKLPDPYKQEHSTTTKPHEVTLNRHKRTICHKCGQGGGGNGGYGGYGGGGYGGGYGGGHGGGGTPTNIIVVPIQPVRYPQGGHGHGHGGNGHGHGGNGHGHGNYGGGGGGGYNQPSYPGPGGCGGRGCGVNYPQQPNYNQGGGCGNGGCGGNGGNLGGSFSYAQASAASGNWGGK